MEVYNTANNGNVRQGILNKAKLADFLMKETSILTADATVEDSPEQALIVRNVVGLMPLLTSNAYEISSDLTSSTIQAF